MNARFGVMVAMVGVVSALLVSAPACGPRAFTKGQYDDPANIRLLDDKFGESDMQLIAKKLVDSLVSDPIIANKTSKPLVIVGTVRNRTQEHIDVKSMTDKIRTALIRSRRFSFIDKEAREDIAEEYDYQGSGYVDRGTAKGPGGQVGADYMITGDIATNVQEVGKQKYVYYKVTLNLTHLKKGVIEWTDEKEIRKAFKKRRVSM